MKTLYELPSARIKIDADLKILQLRFRGVLDEVSYRDLMIRLIELIRENNIRGLLVDARDSVMKNAENLDLLLDNEKEGISKVPLKKVARLISDDIAFEARIQRLYGEGLLGNVKLKFFTEKNAALSWLKS
ncbi:MAG TPA: hypothetical protein VK927_11860 [Adhaeribacter sp.]|nr:hypothetical protein [Adhaeribacter sp.]